MSLGIHELVQASVAASVHVWLGAVWFFVVAVVLDFFEIAMPRGDRITLSGALCGAAVVLLQPIPALTIALASAIVSQTASRNRDGARLLSTLIARLLAVLGAWAVLDALDSARDNGIIVALLVPSAYVLVELVVTQLVLSARTGRPPVRLVIGNLRREAPLLAAQVSAAALTVVTYPDMQAWSLIPVAALLLLMRQSYALLLGIRETYRNTVEILVEAAEGQDARRAGHSERSAAIARSIAQKVGLSASQVELLSYAALLHDIDAISGEAPSISTVGIEGGPRAGKSSAVFEGVEFFADVAPILTLCDGDSVDASSASEGTLLGALIVALASDVDVADNPQVGLVHVGSAVDRVSPLVPADSKARAVAAALSLGYKIPAVR